MAYDETLADRVREVIEGAPDVTERKMFGGLAFMVRGNMGCGLIPDGLLVRVGPEDYQEALARPQATEMRFTGKPMRGIVHLPASAVESETDLREWVEWGVDYALSLPPK